MTGDHGREHANDPMDAVALAAAGSRASGEVVVFGSVEGFSPGSLEKLNEPPARCGTNRVAITILPCAYARAWSMTRTRKPIGLPAATLGASAVLVISRLAPLARAVTPAAPRA
jgi:hypothetical protein